MTIVRVLFFSEIDPPGGGSSGVATAAGGISPISPQPPPPPTLTAPAERISGGHAAEQSLIPPLTAPRGQATVIPLDRSGLEFEYVLDAFEGLNTRQNPADIGELQARTLKNLLIDRGTLRKAAGSVDVNSSGSTLRTVGLHEAAGLRTLLLHAMEETAGWTPSDATNFFVTQETSIKVEGAASLKITAQGAGAHNDTIVFDYGAGATKDLSQYDYIELIARTPGWLLMDLLAFGVSEDNVTYTEIELSVIVHYPGATSTWGAYRISLTGLSASARDAIRYLRFRYGNSSGNTRTFYVDSIKAYRRTSHLLWARFLGGVASQGGPRDSGSAGVDLGLLSNLSGSWVELSSHLGFLPANTKVRFLDFLGKTYYSVGRHGMGKIANNVFEAWAEPPPAEFIESHLEKLWLFGVWHDYHQLRHADPSVDNVWPVGQTPEGSNGGLFYVGRGRPFLPTGIKAAFAQLYLFTEGDTHILSGTDADSWQLVLAHPGVGLASQEALIEFDAGLIWYDSRFDRIVLWSSQVFDISDPIKPELQAIPPSLKPWAAMGFDGRYMFFSYASAGASANNRLLVYDVIMRHYHGPFEGDWCGFTSFVRGADGSLYVGRADGGVRKVLTGTSDNGAAISVAYRTLLYRRSMNLQLLLRRLWVRFRNTATTVTVNIYKNLQSTPAETFTLTPTGLPTELKGKRLKVVGDILEVEIIESSTNPLEIESLGATMARVRQGRSTV